MARSGFGRRGVVAVVLLVLVVAVGAGLFVVQQRATERRLDAAASAAAQTFATAAQNRDLGPARLVELAPATAQEQYAALTKELGQVQPVVEVTAVRRKERTATADLTWRWPFGPQGWTYTTELPLATTGPDDAPWGARWSPAVVHPAVAAGDTLAARRTTEPRADVLGRDGAALVTSSPVVDVGIQPSRATDPAGLARTLGELLDVDAAALEGRIRAAGPDAFVSVVTLRRSDYDPLRAKLQALRGTVFRESTLPLAPTRAFARALLGTVGPVTAELVEGSAGRLAAGDVGGLSGLQRTFDARLAGTAGVRVEQVRGTQRTELFAVPPAAGVPVRLTLEARVQNAADAALAGATGGNGNAALEPRRVNTTPKHPSRSCRPATEIGWGEPPAQRARHVHPADQDGPDKIGWGKGREGGRGRDGRTADRTGATATRAPTGGVATSAAGGRRRPRGPPRHWRRSSSAAPPPSRRARRRRRAARGTAHRASACP